jgi:hypothetical protein
MTFKTLFSGAPDLDAPAVVGEWFSISIIPDLATDERLNIGIGLAHQDQLNFKIVEDLQGFKCLYGKNGLASIKDLIHLSIEHFKESGNIESPSSHILIGEKRPAAGNSVDEILNDLFYTMVPIAFAHHGDKMLQLKEPALTVDNKRLRREVFKQIEMAANDNYHKIIQQQAVMLDDKSGITHRLDLPILDRYGDHFSKSLYGSIVSAHYVSDVHRGFFLNGASTSLITASSLLSNSHGSLFILRPEEGTPGYTDEMLDIIDEEIDNTAWPLKNRFDIEVHVESSSEAIARNVLHMIGQHH